jgi:hypothetical protein
VPDQPAPLIRFAHALNHLLDGPCLMLPKQNLGQHIFLHQEDDVIAQKLHKPPPLEERLHLALEVARLDVLPVEEVLFVGAPGRPVKEMDKLRDLEYLAADEQLRRLLVITANLLHPFRHAFALLRCLRLGNRQRNAVDEKNDVSPIAKHRSLDRPFLGDLKDVRIDVVEVDQANVALAILLRHKDRLLAAQPLQSVAIAFNAGLEPTEPTQNVCRSVGVHDARIQSQELRLQHVGKVQTRIPAAPTQCLFWCDVLPADLLGVFDHGILDGRTLGHGRTPWFQIDRKSPLAT